MAEAASAHERGPVNTPSYTRIAELVDGIMIQTHMLALALATEAARTNDQDLGLTAASEASLLAEFSVEAAEEIRRLMALGLDEDGMGTPLVDRARRDVEIIALRMRQLTAMIEEFAFSSIPL